MTGVENGVGGGRDGVEGGLRAQQEERIGRRGRSGSGIEGGEEEDREV